MDREEELLDAFKTLDRKKSGKFSAIELKHLVSKMGEQFTEEEADQMIKDADPNGTGEVKYH